MQKQLDHIEKHDRFQICFDMQLATESNILVSGTNKTGKSRLACGICSLLQYFNWKLIVFDNSGVWPEISDIPLVYTVEKDTLRIIQDGSIVYDISYLTPKNQRKLVDQFLEYLWNQTRKTPKRHRKQTLLVLEEFELYGARARYADHLHRIMHAGRNVAIRTLAVTTDLALVDPSFTRLCQQRYHGRLGIEVNSKRRFKGYYGSDWCRIATQLDLGYFIYLNRDKLKIIHVPLFDRKTHPRPALATTANLQILR